MRIFNNDEHKTFLLQALLLSRTSSLIKRKQFNDRKYSQNEMMISLIFFLIDCDQRGTEGISGFFAQLFSRIVPARSGSNV